MIDLDELERLCNTPNPHEPDSVCDGFDEALRNAAPTLLALARAGRRLAEASSELSVVPAVVHILGMHHTAQCGCPRCDVLAALAAFRKADA